MGDELPFICTYVFFSNSDLNHPAINQYRASKKEIEVYFETQFNKLVDTNENRMEKECGNCSSIELPLWEELGHLNEAQVS